MTNLEKLRELRGAQDRKELAKLLGFAPKALTSIIYKTAPETKYTTFEIAKKSGGVRVTQAPISKLKKLQTHLAHLLPSRLSNRTILAILAGA